jgi:N-succinyldiaminopimelate aminotransferase
MIVLAESRPTAQMNPDLQLLQPYPFERLRALLAGTKPNSALKHIVLSIGEPKHETPAFICQSLADNLSGLSSYPMTAGSDELRSGIAGWLRRRYRLDRVDPATQVLPVLGSRESLFALAQVVVDRTRAGASVICPNPFYQIYEGAALLAGARPYFINTTAENGFRFDIHAVPDEVWARTQLIFVCSPSNPTGNVVTLEEWRALFALSDKYGFVIASDECYSEIYLDTAQPPLGSLEAAQALGRTDYRNLIASGSLSKRSNVPGMRSGYVAGDADIMKAFARYRTYHGSAMSPAVQAASIAAWQDEAHVIENRRLYKEKFNLFYDIVNPVLPLRMPAASFYFWARTPIADTEFARRLFADQHITVLPGSYLGREAHGTNPGTNYVRLALVHSLEDCEEAARRIAEFARRL